MNNEQTAADHNYEPNVTRIRVGIDSTAWGGDDAYDAACTEIAEQQIRRQLKGEYPNAKIEIDSEAGGSDSVHVEVDGHRGQCEHADDCDDQGNADCECECPVCEWVENEFQVDDLEEQIAADIGDVDDRVNGGDLTPDVPPFADEDDA